jgi:hypothetical protein
VLAAPGTSALIARLPGIWPAGRVRIPGPTYNEHARAFAAQGWQVGDGASDALVLVNPNNPDGRLWQAERGSGAVHRAGRKLCRCGAGCIADRACGAARRGGAEGAGQVLGAGGAAAGLCHRRSGADRPAGGAAWAMARLWPRAGGGDRCADGPRLGRGDTGQAGPGCGAAGRAADGARGQGWWAARRCSGWPACRMPRAGRKRWRGTGSGLGSSPIPPTGCALACREPKPTGRGWRWRCGAWHERRPAGARPAAGCGFGRAEMALVPPAASGGADGARGGLAGQAAEPGRGPSAEGGRGAGHSGGGRGGAWRGDCRDPRWRAAGGDRGGDPAGAAKPGGTCARGGRCLAPVAWATGG